MPLTTLYNSILTTIETQLKTITELADVGSPARTKVHFYKGKPAFIAGETEVTIVPGPLIPVTGVTVKSTWDAITIYVDLLYYRKADETLKAAYLVGLTVAEKIYDKFHLTSISGLVHICRATILSGEGTLSQKNIDAIPFRVELLCEVAVTQ